MGVLDPVARVAATVGRAGTWVGHARELASTALTVGMWPTGVVNTPAAGDPSEPRRDGGDAVLLLHGLGANRSNWWFVTRQLRAAGFGCIHAFTDHAVGVDLPRLAARCAERIDDIGRRDGVERVHVIGHSLGGIVARYAIGVLGASGVATCVTIASPHGGVPLARLGSAGVIGRQLRPDSPHMALMRSSAQESATRYVAYFSNLDVVVPARRAMIVEPELDATNVLVKDHGHFSVMLSRQLTSSLADHLRRGAEVGGGVAAMPGVGSLPGNDAAVGEASSGVTGPVR